MFKSGDSVRIGITPKTKGTIVQALSHSTLHNITIYVVDIGGFKVRIPDSHLTFWLEYDGNEPGNWADLRHIWRP